MDLTLKKHITLTLIALFAGLLLAGLFFTLVQAQSPTPTDNEVNAVAKQLYCPVCENISLDVCPTTACAQWRALIRAQLAEGKTVDEIKEYFVANYGDRVLATPPTRGFNWLVYILPPLFFLGGVYMVYRVLRTMKYKKPDQPAQPPVEPGEADQADPYFARVEAELEQHRKNGE
ncbi:MAG TPA: cytochrome c-type biogenesis protein [Bellilinea sp.]